MSKRTREALSGGTTLYSIATVADRLDVSQDTVRRLIARGELSAISIGSTVRIDAAELEAFVERRKQAGHVADGAPDTTPTTEGGRNESVDE